MGMERDRKKAWRPFAVVLAAMVVLAAGVRAGEKKEITGTLRTIRGVRILTLTGKPRENGYARGYLMAPELKRGIDYALEDLLPKAVSPNLMVMGILAALDRPAAWNEEIEGIIEGMEARLGENGMYVKDLGRNLTASDYWGLTAFPDVGCSSFAAWGGMTAGDGMLVGRNLDYPNSRRLMNETAAIIVKRPADRSHRAWVDAGSALQVGAGTCMREDGVFLSIHDAASTGPPRGTGHLRWFVAREIIENVTGGARTGAEALAICRKHQILRGTNFFICAAGAGASTVEYDGNTELDSGATLRAAAGGREWMAVTNHFRTRSAPEECSRYGKLARRLEAIERGGKKPGTAEDAWEVIETASVDISIITAAYDSARRRMLVGFTDGKRASHEVKPVALTLDELLGGEE
ncbi:MAG: hypothetical protein JW909_12995 [Planctomycetes bacterium]|nr:hypothetical protein [Planctomycetota bacterium]